MVAKRARGNAINKENSDNKVGDTSSKKYIDSFQYIVLV